MTADTSPLHVIIPSRGRPQHVARTAAAWWATGAMYGNVRVTYALDADDPTVDAYAAEIVRQFGHLGSFQASGSVGGMVGAINTTGRALANGGFTSLAPYGAWRSPFALAVLNDDHVPRSVGWHEAVSDALTAMGTGIVYGDDLLRGESLCTAWAMTTDIVQATNRVVPCLVSHLFADNAVMDLGRAAAVLQYLPEVVIEHLHYTAGKAPLDEGYERVNSRTRWRADQARYTRWLAGPRFAAQVEAVKALRVGHLAGGES